MASSPTFDPNLFSRGITEAEYRRIQAETAEKNRATQENYHPGSIIKPLVALAALEQGLDPHAYYEVQPHPRRPGRGIFRLGTQEYPDTAPPGLYDFETALIKSSNAYFIACGLTNIQKIVQLGAELHLGEHVLRLSGITNRQETAGLFPRASDLRSGWRSGHTALLCMGQGAVDVTPLQMAVMASALANGGNVVAPRLVDRVEPQDPLSGRPTRVFPRRILNRLSVSPRTLQTLKQAMLADTEKRGGTAYEAFLNWQHSQVMPVCGKTGTAEKKDVRNQLETQFTWFLSFAPHHAPRYAVVVMVEGGSSGGGTCAPVARRIYDGIVDREQMQRSNPGVASVN